MRLKAKTLGVHKRRGLRVKSIFIFAFWAVIGSLALVFAPQPGAEIYQWVDENGVKRYSNTPPADAEDAKIIFNEKPFDESAHQKRIEADQRALDKLLEQVAEEDRQAALQQRQKLEEANQDQTLSQQDLITAEKRRLMDKINELEALPFSHFGSENKRRTQINYYRERLRLLEKNPDNYFSRPEKKQPGTD